MFLKVISSPRKCCLRRYYPYQVKGSRVLRISADFVRPLASTPDFLCNCRGYIVAHFLGVVKRELKVENEKLKMGVKESDQLGFVGVADERGRGNSTAPSSWSRC